MSDERIEIHKDVRAESGLSPDEIKQAIQALFVPKEMRCILYSLGAALRQVIDAPAELIPEELRGSREDIKETLSVCIAKLLSGTPENFRSEMQKVIYESFGINITVSHNHCEPSPPSAPASALH